MKPARESKKEATSAEPIAKIAGRGEGVSRFFTNRGRVLGWFAAGPRQVPPG